MEESTEIQEELSNQGQVTRVRDSPATIQGTCISNKLSGCLGLERLFKGYVYHTRDQLRVLTSTRCVTSWRNLDIAHEQGHLVGNSLVPSVLIKHCAMSRYEDEQRKTNTGAAVVAPR